MHYTYGEILVKIILYFYVEIGIRFSIYYIYLWGFL